MSVNDRCEYKYIEEHPKSAADNATCKPLIRQIAICSISWISFVIAGISFGIPTVMLPQIRKDANSTIIISENMDATLKSMYGYATILWTVLLTYLTIVSGRRIPLFLVSLAMISGYTLLYYSNSTTCILISEILQTSSFGCCCCISIIILCEYAAPKYRGLLMNFTSGMFYWGVWMSNAMGTFFPWRSIPVFGIACSLFMLPVIFFPESPSWLASKGRFEECNKTHRWLRGTDEDSEKELKKLINTQEEYLREKGSKSRTSIKEIVTMIKSTVFYKPLLLCTVTILMYHCTGKLVCVMYSIDIIKKITDDERMAYIGMLILDGISVLGMYTGSAISKYVSRRTLLFTTSPVAILFLFILSLYLYLIKLSVITENNFVSITLLSIISLSLSCGIMLMGSTITGELISLKYRSVSMLTTSIINNLTYSIILQPTPYIFRYFGLHGAFLSYGISFGVFTAINYKFLPETKDKSLLEIEEYFKTNVSNKDVAEIFLSETEE